MTRRHPRLWLMTDERMGDGLWDALTRLPRGSGVVFRHYRLASGDRRALFETVRRIARARRLTLLVAGPPTLAIAWRADGAHNADRRRRAARSLLRSMPCHDRPALIAARRSGVTIRFVSPIYPTRSHPGAPVLGRVRAGLMIDGNHDGVIALGGMNRRRYAAVRALGFAGWAAIDAWS